MKKIYSYYLAGALLGCLGVASNAVALDAKIHGSYSVEKQQFVLTPGSPLYKKWQAWIKDKNAERSRQPSHYQTTFDDGSIGKITIMVTQPDSNQASPQESSTIHTDANAAASPDNGPPAPWPTTGTSGEQIAVINQTTTVYQKWIYIYSEGDGGDGARGWGETSFQTAGCNTTHLCLPDLQK